MSNKYRATGRLSDKGVAGWSFITMFVLILKQEMGRRIAVELLTLTRRRRLLSLLTPLNTDFLT